MFVDSTFNVQMFVFFTFLSARLELGRGCRVKQLPPGITRPLHVTEPDMWRVLETTSLRIEKFFVKMQLQSAHYRFVELNSINQFSLKRVNIFNHFFVNERSQMQKSFFKKGLLSYFGMPKWVAVSKRLKITGKKLISSYFVKCLRIYKTCDNFNSLSIVNNKNTSKIMKSLSCISKRKNSN